MADIETGLAELCRADPRLEIICKSAGPLSLRRSPPGFQSLVSVIVSQQVSKASAHAIFSRLTSLADPLSPNAIIAANEDLFRKAGLSRPKQKTIRAVAEAVAGGAIDLEALCRQDPAKAIEILTSLHGIGLWTAEVYLMFSAGHRDIFPAKDIALQIAVGHALSNQQRPTERELVVIAESWSPWRSVAARLFWAYYAKIRGREALPA